MNAARARLDLATRWAAVLLLALGPAAIGRGAEVESLAPLAAPSEVLTLEEAAAFLRVPAGMLGAEAEAGRVPARRIGSEWRFSRAALLAWLAGGGPIGSAVESLQSTEQLASLSGRGEEGDEPPAQVGEPPEVEGAEEVFLRDQQLLLAPGDLVLEPAGYYTHSDSRELAVVGLSTIDFLDIEERTGSARFTARYGLLPETELSAEYFYARQDRTAEIALSDAEVGDVDDLKSFSLGLRRTLLHERPGIPNLVLLLGADLPVANMSPGFTAGITAVSSLDPVVLFGGVQYERTLARNFDDLALLEHDHNLTATLGYAFAINEELTLSAALSGVFASQTTFHLRGGEIVLDSEDDYYLRFGITRMLSPGRYVEPVVTFLLNGKESEVTLGVSFPFLIDRGEGGS
jgi:excisionase family DNA binding protein